LRCNHAGIAELLAVVDELLEPVCAILAEHAACGSAKARANI
jgi:hypothetical protein